MPDPVPVTRLEGFLNGDDLTPVTRLEQFLAGDDLTPVTRLEWFLKKAASGGGISPIYSGEMVVENSTTSMATFKTIEINISGVSTPCAVLVKVVAKNPASGQFLILASVCALTEVKNETALSRGGVGRNATSTSSNNNAGIYLGTATITGAPENPVLTLKLNAKKSSPFNDGLDGTYSVDVFII